MAEINEVVSATENLYSGDHFVYLLNNHRNSMIDSFPTLTEWAILFTPPENPIFFTSAGMSDNHSPPRREKNTLVWEIKCSHHIFVSL